MPFNFPELYLADRLSRHYLIFGAIVITTLTIVVDWIRSIKREFIRQNTCPNCSKCEIETIITTTITQKSLKEAFFRPKRRKTIKKKCKSCEYEFPRRNRWQRRWSPSDSQTKLGNYIS